MITLTLFSVVFVAFPAATGRAPSLAPRSRCSPGICFTSASIVLGFALGRERALHAYRDLNQVWEVVTHAGFFVAPIIYPIDILPERFTLLSGRRRR